jgi:hypothetical protein
MRGVTPDDPRRFVPDLPSAVADVAMRALCDDPNDRYATAAAMGEALEKAASGVSASARRDVARVVVDLAAESCARVRQDLEVAQTVAYVPAHTVFTELLPTTNATLEANTSRSRHWQTTMGAGLFVTVAVCLLLAALRGAAPAAAPSAHEDAAPATTAEGPRGSSTRASDSPRETASVTPVPATHPTETAPVRGRGERRFLRGLASERRNSSPAPPAHKAPALRPAYESPYE